MIVCDANILLYAYNLVSPQHTAARNWVEATFSGEESVLLPWPVITAFLRISTSSQAFNQPLSMAEATETVGEWLEQPKVMAAVATDRHWLILSRVLTEGQVSGRSTMDAEIAAYAIEYGATLCTCDRGFARFPGLKFINPLTS